MLSSRISIFIGHFGSGKTEISLNYAQKLSFANKKVTLIDLDIVNPFFRSSDAENELSKYNIKLIKPVYANTNVDVPALPPQIYSVFSNKNSHVVIDVGGDDLGARAVSCYSEHLQKEDYSMYFVVNTKRLFTCTEEKIENMLSEIKNTTRLPITHIINNTNLLEQTNIEDILESNKIIKSVSKKHNIQFAFISATVQTAEELVKYTDDKIFVLDGFIKLPWNKF